MKSSGSWVNNRLQVNIACVGPWMVWIMTIISGTRIARKQSVLMLQEWIACFDSSGTCKGMQVPCGMTLCLCECQAVLNYRFGVLIKYG